jgi:hypothetical protein
MRQLGIAAVLGVVGMLLAAVLVRFVAAGTTSIADSWSTAGAVLPVFGVVIGAVLSHRLSRGADPWPITDRARRIPFALLGGVLGALTWYVCCPHRLMPSSHSDRWRAVATIEAEQLFRAPEQACGGA